MLRTVPHQTTEPVWDLAELFPHQGAWSEDDYLELETNHLIEYSHGRLEVLPMPTLSHQPGDYPQVRFDRSCTAVAGDSPTVARTMCTITSSSILTMGATLIVTIPVPWYNRAAIELHGPALQPLRA